VNTRAVESDPSLAVITPRTLSIEKLLVPLMILCGGAPDKSIGTDISSTGPSTHATLAIFALSGSVE
jgi:hypothetical protein